MLVFISDLHLTDGTTCETISPDAFAIFVDDLRWMVAQASSRREADGSERFEPIERVDLVLLGDIFDVLRSARWADADVRPWTPELAADADARARAHERLAAQVDAITEAIIAFNHGSGGAGGGPGQPDSGRRGLAALRALVEEGIALDPADLPRDAVCDASLRIPVRTWYLPGNHDWFYNVGFAAYDRARQRIVDALGLAHAADQPFPHTLAEAPPALRQAFAEHKVYAQHGDVYDGENIQLELDVDDPRPGHSRRAYSSIGDMIVIELLNGLPGQIVAALRALADPLADDPRFVRALAELDNVRPMLAIPQWLAGILQRHETGRPEHRARERARREAVGAAVQARLKTITEDPFARRLDHLLRWDLVDTLEAGAVLSGWLSVEALAKVSRLGERLSRPASYREHAIACLETLRRDLAADEAQVIVFGHTHHPEVVPLDLDGPSGWVYINSGTWRRVHERCVAETGRFEFISFHVMSVVAAYKGSERRGRPYETWTGTLGSRPG